MLCCQQCDLVGKREGRSINKVPSEAGVQLGSDEVRAATGDYQSFKCGDGLSGNERGNSDLIDCDSLVGQVRPGVLTVGSSVEYLFWGWPEAGHGAHTTHLKRHGF